jgi:hypothetical protein
MILRYSPGSVRARDGGVYGVVLFGVVPGRGGTPGLLGLDYWCLRSLANKAILNFGSCRSAVEPSPKSKVGKPSLAARIRCCCQRKRPPNTQVPLSNTPLLLALFLRRLVTSNLSFR